MAAKFHSELHRRGEVTYLKLGGVIDEDNDLSSLAEQLGQGAIGAGPVVIDLGDVERINSCGVRDWVNWLGRLERGGGRPVLVECSPSIVAQVNLVHNFTGGGVVRSFYAPYFCPRCEREKVLLLETRDVAGRPGYRAPGCRCDECDGPMDFDDMEESYFAFLASTARVQSDKRVDQVITEFTPSEGGPKLRSRTSVGLTGVGLGIPTAMPPLSSLPSLASLQSLPVTRRGGEPYTAITAGRLQTSPGPTASAAAALAGPRASQPGLPVASTPTTQATAAPAAGRGWLLLVGALVVAALAVVAYLVLGGGAPATVSTLAPAAGASPAPKSSLPSSAR